MIIRLLTQANFNIFFFECIVKKLETTQDSTSPRWDLAKFSYSESDSESIGLYSHCLNLRIKIQKTKYLFKGEHIMERKTIGGFIAALRKANGMTQKDLAEKLNVSDKTISRWERDDGTPDLAVIPVIAEIFNVTCDELIRGKRKSPVERTETAEASGSTSKTEKQRQHLLKSTLSQYKNHTYIAIGISVVGLIAALICNLAFLKAVLGFFLGAIFFVASIVCQAIFVNKAFFSVEDAELNEKVISDFKRKVINFAEISIGFTVSFIGFTIPLILPDAYMGVNSDSLLILGAIGAAALLLVYSVVLYFLNAFLLKKMCIVYLKRRQRFISAIIS